MDKDKVWVVLAGTPPIYGPFETLEAAQDWCARFNAAIEPASPKAEVYGLRSPVRVLQLLEARSAKAPA
jgi:hypothetical protein